METNEHATVETPVNPAEVEGNETTDQRPAFEARIYIRRTREVLTEQFKEASKVQANTRAALFDVWKDLRADLGVQFSAFEASAKRQTENLWKNLPFVASNKPTEQEGNGEPAQQA